MPLTLHSLLGNGQRLDGGAMFGNAPRAVWQKWSPPDDRHRIQLACRALLVRVEEAGRAPMNVLLETGIGTFFSPELRDRYGVMEPQHALLDSLQAIGLTDADIDAVVLSHLHFDHAGGLLAPYALGANGRWEPRLLFPKARFLVGAVAWERALHPHTRDRASFIPELHDLLLASSRLEIIDGPEAATLGPSFRFQLSNGHTPGLLLTEVQMPSGPVLFAADLIPGMPWLRRAITMGYDRYPELLIDEKSRVLDDLVARNGRVFFTHDPAIAMTRLVCDAKGEVAAGETWQDVRALSA